jgi:predicted CxxxxCH...CXXCH cytochrome family protein
MELTKILNLKMKYIFFYLLAIIFAIYIASCSDLKDNIPSVPEVNIHGSGVYDAESPDYHPKTIAKSPEGMFGCQDCHAADFSGGVTGVGCNTPNCHPVIGVHVSGITDPSSGNFHGKYIRDRQWEMRTCRPCHGERYGGGLVSPSCLDCHIYPGGPENCTTCHGSTTSNAPPKDLNGNTSTSDRGVGAHQAHLMGNINGKNLTCTECHNVPGGVYTPGHLDPDNRAEVLMNNPLANLKTNDPSTSQYDPSLPLFEPDPLYNSSTLSCSNTYCHGNFKNGNLDNVPNWTDPSTSQCGSCHGNGTNPLPKTNSEGGSHPGSTNCSNCHGGVVDADLNIINPSKHIDGLLNLFGNDIKY